jgi:hypothetical protein
LDESTLHKDDSQAVRGNREFELPLTKMRMFGGSHGTGST